MIVNIWHRNDDIKKYFLDEKIRIITQKKKYIIEDSYKGPRCKTKEKIMQFESNFEIIV